MRVKLYDGLNTYLFCSLLHFCLKIVSDWLIFVECMNELIARISEM